MSNSFNPREHLIALKTRQGSAEYLPVQWRLVWFRLECPNGTIETEIIHLDPDKETEEETYVWNNETRRSEKVIKTARGLAIVRATVKNGTGGVAMGTKMEKAASFGDWLEKAETGAIGRALAALGYGTQFTGDEFDERHRIVDAPVDRGASIAAVENSEERKAPPATVEASQKKDDGPDPRSLATDEQWSSIRTLCRRLEREVPDLVSVPNYGAAKELIAQLAQEYKQSRGKAS